MAMASRRSPFLLVVWIVGVAGLLSTVSAADGAKPSPIPIWPLPQSLSHGTNQIDISTSFSFQSLGFHSDILDKAIQRYAALCTPRYSTAASASSSSTALRSPHRLHKNADIPKGTVENNVLEVLEILVVSMDESLGLHTDESYELTVDAPRARLTSTSPFGAMRGLETFSQLISYDFGRHTYVINQTPWTIADVPRFAHRGVLMDTSRHFFPVPTLLKIIDSLAYAKLNVFHWHAVDAQSFPLESKTFPNLWMGSWSPEEKYTTDDIQLVVEYARERGIRVIVELDGPGHAYSWGVGYPDMLPDNYTIADGCDFDCPSGSCDVPLDPSKEFTYDVLRTVYREYTGGVQGSGYFPDDFFHLGGDEVETGCWNASVPIKKFMDAHNMTDFMDLYMYYILRTHDLINATGRTPIYWEEVFNRFQDRLPKNTVIQVWLDHKTLSQVVAHGYRGILSNYDRWYLDYESNNWTVFYQNEPMENITDPAQQKLVLGGESCAWSETQTPGNVFVRLWPRLAATAERLWSPWDIKDIDEARPRLEAFRCLLFRRGIDSGPVGTYAEPPGPGSCYTQ